MKYEHAFIPLYSPDGKQFSAWNSGGMIDTTYGTATLVTDAHGRARVPYRRLGEVNITPSWRQAEILVREGYHIVYVTFMESEPMPSQYTADVWQLVALFDLKYNKQGDKQNAALAKRVYSIKGIIYDRDISTAKDVPANFSQVISEGINMAQTPQCTSPYYIITPPEVS